MEIKVPREIKVGTHRVRIFYELSDDRPTEET